jgi:threonine dehydratase
MQAADSAGRSTCFPVTPADIEAAHERIRSGIYFSPCPDSIPLSEIAGCRLWCKLDYLQRTGSFKERGARNALLLLPEAQRRRGVISASAGNHALGLAYHGDLLGVPVTVVMPRTAPLVKVATCRRLHARVVLEGDNFAEAKAAAERISADEGLAYISPYDHPDVVAGQGTMGLEILEQVPDLEAVVVPVGGAGLIAGVATAIKARRPEVFIAGVEPERCASFAAALAAGGPVDCAAGVTLADGLAVPRVGTGPFEMARQLVDKVVTVNEDDLSLAVLRILELEKGVVEGAGAAPLAALIAGKLPELEGRRVVVALCGGNIDPGILTRVIERGLVADGRVCRLNVVIRDRPGGLADLTAVIARAGANIKEIVHERVFASSDVSAVCVMCTIETRDRAHLDEVHRALEAHRLPVRVVQAT